MSLLFPGMLLGLLGLSVPVILHLIARQRFPVQPFPSIMLLDGERRTNVLAPRLVDVPQLLLRLLVLAILALAMARLFLPWSGGTAAPRNVVVVIDASASMSMVAESPDGKQALIDAARERARVILAGVKAPGRSALIQAGAAAEVLASLEPGAEHALAALDGVKIFEGTGAGLVEATRMACDMLRGRKEVRSQIVLLTDLRAGALAARSRRDLDRIAAAQADLGDKLQLLVIDLAGENDRNVALTDAIVRGREVRVGEDAHVIATVVNTGGAAQDTRVRLAIGDRQEPAVKSINVAPGERAVVDLTARVNRALRTFARATIDEDALPLDDGIDVPLNVVDMRRVLIVDGGAAEGAAAAAGAPGMLAGSAAPPPGAAAAAEAPPTGGAAILRYVLNPGRELGQAYGTGIESTMVTPEALAGQLLSKYDIVILYDVSSLPDAAMHDLETFTRQGKALWFICSAGLSAPRFNRSLAVAAAGHDALAPAEVGNDRALENAVGIDALEANHPLLTPFRDQLRGDLSVARFVRLREVLRPLEGAEVIVRGGGHPLIIERALGRGRVLMLMFGFELDRGNIARTRVFPPLMWRITDYLTGRLRVLPPDIVSVSHPAVLDVSEPAFALATALELQPAPRATAVADEAADEAAAPAAPAGRLTPGDDSTVLVESLPAGRYLLQKARDTNQAAVVVTYARGVVVRPDAAESEMTRATPEGLQEIFGAAARIVKPGEALELEVRGGEPWMWLVVLLLVAYAVEAFAGWAASARRERERALEGSGA